MLEAFMSSTGWLFWLVVLTFIVLETWATENESLTLMVIVAVAGVIILSVWSATGGPLGWVYVHPLQTLALVPLYFVVGTLWSLWKWHGVVMQAVASYQKAREKLVDKSLPLDNKQWRPSVSNNKERLVTWIAGWPFSVLWSALSLPRALAAAIYRKLTSLFQHMVDKAFA